MTSPTRAPGGRRGHRGPLQVAAGVVAFVAVVASVVVAFTNDARFLKLALVAVLWVAVGALFFVEQMRRRADTAVARSADQRAVYELELEREVRARREHELATEREVRERVTAEVRTEGRLELDELREELKALRENLSLLLSGDLLVERVALRAESTRLRSLTDTARLESGGAGQLGGAPDGPVPLEAETVEPETVVPETVVPETVVLGTPEPEFSGPVAAASPEPTVEAPQTAEIEQLPAEEDVVAAPVAVPEPAVAAEVPQPAAAPAPEPAAVRGPFVPEPFVPEPVHGQDAPTEVLAVVPEDEPEPQPAAVDPELPTEGPDSGAHSAGRSVSDLLAAYGGSSAGGRRRRRSED